MKDNTHINKILHQSTPTLSKEAKATLWSNIETNLSVPVSTPSPYHFTFISARWLAPVALALILVISVGGVGTVAAAEQSKPGDLLYPIERAVENLQLFLASDERSAELQAEFARKRLLELRAIIDEELASLDNETTINASSSATTSDSTKRSVSIATTENTRINFAVSEFVKQLSTVENNDARQAVLSLIKDTDGIIVGEDEEKRVRIEDNKVEFRYEDDETGERIRIREKDGELRVEVKSDDSKDEDKDQDDDSRDSRRTSSATSIDEAEADVFRDTTSVKVELRNGQTLRFTTKATSRAGVVAEIVARTGATSAEVDAVLDFEVEDRSSRTSEQDDDSRDSDERESNDNSDSRDDNDERDDNRSDDSTSQTKIEVEVKNGRAEVKVEQNNQKDEFVLTYINRTALIAEIALKTGLSQTAVSSVLDLEIDD